MICERGQQTKVRGRGSWRLKCLHNDNDVTRTAPMPVVVRKGFSIKFRLFYHSKLQCDERIRSGTCCVSHSFSIVRSLLLFLLFLCDLITQRFRHIFVSENFVGMNCIALISRLNSEFFGPRYLHNFHDYFAKIVIILMCAARGVLLDFPQKFHCRWNESLWFVLHQRNGMSQSIWIHVVDDSMDSRSKIIFHQI